MAGEEDVRVSKSTFVVVMVAMIVAVIVSATMILMAMAMVMLLEMLVLLPMRMLLLLLRILLPVTVIRRHTEPHSGAHADHDRAKARSGWMSPLSAAFIASRYLVRASPSFTGLAEPQVNDGRPSFMTSTSEIRRACLPLPFGNG
jgi:hypothetical protein